MLMLMSPICAFCWFVDGESARCAYPSFLASLFSRLRGMEETHAPACCRSGPSAGCVQRLTSLVGVLPFARRAQAGPRVVVQPPRLLLEDRFSRPFLPPSFAAVLVRDTMR